MTTDSNGMQLTPSDAEILRSNEVLYGIFNRSVQQDEAIEEDAVRKALNLPRKRKMNVTNNGFDWKALAVIVGGLLGVAWMGKDYVRPDQPQQPHVVYPPQVPVYAPVDNDTDSGIIGIGKRNKVLNQAKESQ